MTRPTSASVKKLGFARGAAWWRSVLIASAVFGVCAATVVGLSLVPRRPFVATLKLDLRQVELRSARPWELTDRRVSRVAVQGVDSVRVVGGGNLAPWRARPAARSRGVTRLVPLSPLTHISIVGSGVRLSTRLGETPGVASISLDDIAADVMLLTVQSSAGGEAQIDATKGARVVCTRCDARGLNSDYALAGRDTLHVADDAVEISARSAQDLVITVEAARVDLAEMPLLAGVFVRSLRFGAREPDRDTSWVLGGVIDASGYGAAVHNLGRGARLELRPAGDLVVDSLRADRALALYVSGSFRDIRVRHPTSTEHSLAPSYLAWLAGRAHLRAVVASALSVAGLALGLLAWLGLWRKPSEVRPT
jgi:hypothetical protein